MARRDKLARPAPQKARSEIDWRAAREKMTHEKYLELRRQRWQTNAWHISDSQLRERAHDEATAAVQRAIRSQSERGWG